MRPDLKGVDSLERRIYHTMVDGRGRLRRGYARFLNPFGRYRHDQYPANQIGLLARVEKPLQDMHIRLGEIEELLKRDVSSVLGSDSSTLMGSVRNVIARIGVESYNAEWRNRESQVQLKEKIEASTDITVLANRLLSELSEKHIIEVFRDITREKTHPNKRDMYTVMDLGCGMHAATIGAHLEKLEELSQEGMIPCGYNDFVRVVLVDVDPNATRNTEDIISDPGSYRNLGFGFRPPGRVERFNMNFNEMESDKSLMEYRGRVDTFLSGAAPCHITEKDEFFSTNRRLCSHRGAFFAWDWLAKTFMAQYLRIPRFSPGSLVFEVRDEGSGDVLTHQFSGIDEVPEDFYAKLKGEKWRSIYELREEDVAPHLANIEAWLGYWGYKVVDPVSETMIKRRIDGIDISDHHRKMFHRRIEQERGYSPINDFVIGTLSKGRRFGLRPFETSRVAYNFIESYGIELSRMMQEAGFEAYDLSFREALDLAAKQNVGGSFSMAVEDLNETQRSMMPALNFSVAYDDKEYLDEIIS